MAKALRPGGGKQSKRPELGSPSELLHHHLPPCIIKLILRRQADFNILHDRKHDFPRSINWYSCSLFSVPATVASLYVDRPCLPYTLCPFQSVHCTCHPGLIDNQLIRMSSSSGTAFFQATAMKISSTKKKKGVFTNWLSRNKRNVKAISPATPTPLAPNIVTASGRTKPPPTSKSTKDFNVSVGFNGVHEFLKVVKESSDVFTPLKSVAGGLVACIDVYKRTSGNYEEMERLLTNIDRLSLLAAARLRSCETKATRQRIDNLARALDTEHKKIDAMKERGTLARLAQNTQDEDDLVTSCRLIKEAIDEFQLELGMAVEQDTRDILKNIVFQSLRRSESAAFTAAINTNTVTRGPCTQGTRVGIVDEIFDWAVSDNAGIAPVYWLNGLAGTGKTTIAYTICQRLEAANIPFVSFFCSRQLDSRDTTLLISTICRDLAELFQSYAEEVIPILETNSKLAHAILPVQMNKLLAPPWRESLRQRDGLRVPVVIIDALDESNLGSEFLQELLHVVHNGALPGIKFLVSSRPDPDVVKLCESFPPGAVCHLHDVATKEVGEDISKFLEEKLPNLRGKAELGILSQQSGGLFIYAATIVRFLSPRTPLSSREQLKQLQGILNIWPNSSGMRDVLLLDQLYQQILTHAFMFVSTDVQRERIQVLHTILCAEHSIPLPVIAELASETCDEETVSNIVHSLHAAIYISTKDQCVYWYHQSFAEFVLSSDRANFILPKSPSFGRIPLNVHCDMPVSSALLAASCFRIMRGLRFNICELESSFLLDREVPDLEERAHKKISQALRYASKQWASHLHRVASSYADSLYEDLRDFLHNRFLFWMEALNLIGAKSVSHQQVRLLQEWLQQVPFKDLTDYVDDVSRFVAHFVASPASLSSPHLYISSLATWPPSSPITETWRSRFSNIPLFLHPEGVGALPLVSILADVLEPNMSIVLSGDGTRVALQGRDGVWVWDATTGELLRHWQLGGIIDYYYPRQSLAMSYHGTRVVSGSINHCAIAWDVSTGKQVWQLDHCLEKQSTFLTMSRDGTLFVYVTDVQSQRKWEDAVAEERERRLRNSVVQSSSLTYFESVPVECSVRLLDAKMCAYLNQRPIHDKLELSHDGSTLVAVVGLNLLVWNAAGEQLQLEGHTSLINCVALSGDGTRVASGSYDRSVRIWDSLTGMQLHQLDGHNLSTCFVGLSHDGLRIVTLATDRFIRIWDGTPKEHPRELDGHTRSILWVGMSDDVTRIVSSSRDHTVQLWDGTSGRQLMTLDHSDTQSTIESVVISRDGTRIVSICRFFLWVWDATTGEKLWQLHSEEALDIHFLSVAISQDCIVSGGKHGSVRLWDTETGKQLAEFVGHIGRVNAVSFSPTGAFIVSGSDDCSVRMWDAFSGVELLCLLLGRRRIYFVALSHDGTRIVSSDDHACIQLWDATTGQQLLVLTGHTGIVRSVAMSHDGSRIVSGSKDHSVRIWDGISGVQLKQLHGHLGPVQSVALSGDGNTVVSGSDDCSIRVWENLTTESPWVMDEDGWIVYGSDKFMWLSPDLRHLFLYPHCTRLISRRGYTLVDFTHSRVGTDWRECYTP